MRTLLLFSLFALVLAGNTWDRIKQIFGFTVTVPPPTPHEPQPGDSQDHPPPEQDQEPHSTKQEPHSTKQDQHQQPEQEQQPPESADDSSLPPQERMEQALRGGHCDKISKEELTRMNDEAYSGGSLTFRGMKNLTTDGYINFTTPATSKFTVRQVLGSRKAWSSMIGNLKRGKSYVAFHIAGIKGPTFNCYPTEGMEAICRKDVNDHLSCLADTQGIDDSKFSPDADVFFLKASLELSSGGVVMVVVPPIGQDTELGFVEKELLPASREKGFKMVVVINDPKGNGDTALATAKPMIEKLQATNVVRGKCEPDARCTAYVPPSREYSIYLLSSMATANGENDATFDMLRENLEGIGVSPTPVSTRIVNALVSTVREVVEKSGHTLPLDFGSQYFDIEYVTDHWAKFVLKHPEKFGRLNRTVSPSFPGVTDLVPIDFPNGALLYPLRIPQPESPCRITQGDSRSTITVSCPMRPPCGALTVGRSDCATPRDDFPEAFTTNITVDGSICNYMSFYIEGYGECVLVQRTVKNACPSLHIRPVLEKRPRSSVVQPPPPRPNVVPPPRLTLTLQRPINLTNSTPITWAAQAPLAYANGALQYLLRIPQPATKCAITPQSDSMLTVACNLSSPCEMGWSENGGCPSLGFPSTFATNITINGVICSTDSFYLAGYGLIILVQTTQNNLCPPLRTLPMTLDHYLTMNRRSVVLALTSVALVTATLFKIAGMLRRWTAHVVPLPAPRPPSPNVFPAAQPPPPAADLANPPPAALPPPPAAGAAAPLPPAALTPHPPAAVGAAQLPADVAAPAPPPAAGGAATHHAAAGVAAAHITAAAQPIAPPANFGVTVQEPVRDDPVQPLPPAAFPPLPTALPPPPPPAAGEGNMRRRGHGNNRRARRDEGLGENQPDIRERIV